MDEQGLSKTAQKPLPQSPAKKVDARVPPPVKPRVPAKPANPAIVAKSTAASSPAKVVTKPMNSAAPKQEGAVAERKAIFEAAKAKFQQDRVALDKERLPDLTKRFRRAIESKNYALALAIHEQGADPNGNVNNQNGKEVPILDFLAKQVILNADKADVVKQIQLLTLRICKKRLNFKSINVSHSKKGEIGTDAAMYLLAKHGEILLMRTFFPIETWSAAEFNHVVVAPGAKKKGKDEQGETPLHIAIQNQKFDMVRYLVEIRKVDINKRREKYRAVDPGGYTPLDEAVTALRDMVGDDNEDAAKTARDIIVFLLSKKAQSVRQDNSSFASDILKGVKKELSSKTWQSKDELLRSVEVLESSVVSQSNERTELTKKPGKEIKKPGKDSGAAVADENLEKLITLRVLSRQVAPEDEDDDLEHQLELNVVKEVAVEGEPAASGSEMLQADEKFEPDAPAAAPLQPETGESLNSFGMQGNLAGADDYTALTAQARVDDDKVAIPEAAPVGDAATATIVHSIPDNQHEDPLSSFRRSPTPPSAAEAEIAEQPEFQVVQPVTMPIVHTEDFDPSVDGGAEHLTNAQIAEALALQSKPASDQPAVANEVELLPQEEVVPGLAGSGESSDWDRDGDESTASENDLAQESAPSAIPSVDQEPQSIVAEEAILPLSVAAEEEQMLPAQMTRSRAIAKVFVDILGERGVKIGVFDHDGTNSLHTFYNEFVQYQLFQNGFGSDLADDVSKEQLQALFLDPEFLIDVLKEMEEAKITPVILSQQHTEPLIKMYESLRYSGDKTVAQHILEQGGAIVGRSKDVAPEVTIKNGDKEFKVTPQIGDRGVIKKADFVKDLLIQDDGGVALIDDGEATDVAAALPSLTTFSKNFVAVGGDKVFTNYKDLIAAYKITKGHSKDDKIEAIYVKAYPEDDTFNPRAPASEKRKNRAFMEFARDFYREADAAIMSGVARDDNGAIVFGSELGHGFGFNRELAARALGLDLELDRDAVSALARGLEERIDIIRDAAVKLGEPEIAAEASPAANRDIDAKPQDPVVVMPDGETALETPFEAGPSKTLINTIEGLARHYKEISQGGDNADVLFSLEEPKGVFSRVTAEELPLLIDAIAKQNNGASPLIDAALQGSDGVDKRTEPYQEALFKGMQDLYSRHFGDDAVGKFADLVNIADESGNTAIELAIEQGYYQFANKLRNAGATDVNAKAFADAATDVISGVDDKQTDDIVASKAAHIPLAHRLLNKMIAERNEAPQVAKKPGFGWGILKRSVNKDVAKSPINSEALALLKNLTDAALQEGVDNLKAKTPTGEYSILDVAVRQAVDKNDPEFLADFLDNVSDIKHFGAERLKGARDLVGSKIIDVGLGKKAKSLKPEQIAANAAWKKLADKLQEGSELASAQEDIAETVEMERELQALATDGPAANVPASGDTEVGVEAASVAIKTSSGVAAAARLYLDEEGTPFYRLKKVLQGKSKEEALAIIRKIAESQNGESPLHDILSSEKLEEVMDMKFALALLKTVLGEDGAQEVINLQNNNGHTAFEQAVNEGKYFQARELFLAGAKVQSDAAEAKPVLQYIVEAEAARRDAAAKALGKRSMFGGAKPVGIANVEPPAPALKDLLDSITDESKSRPNVISIASAAGDGSSLLGFVAANAYRRDDPAMLKRFLEVRDIAKVASAEIEAVQQIVNPKQQAKQKGSKPRNAEWADVDKKLQELLSVAQALEVQSPPSAAAAQANGDDDVAVAPPPPPPPLPQGFVVAQDDANQPLVAVAQPVIEDFAPQPQLADVTINADPDQSLAPVIPQDSVDQAAQDNVDPLATASADVSVVDPFQPQPLSSGAAENFDNDDASETDLFHSGTLPSRVPPVVTTSAIQASADGDVIAAQGTTEFERAVHQNNYTLAEAIARANLNEELRSEDGKPILHQILDAEISRIEADSAPQPKAPGRGFGDVVMDFVRRRKKPTTPFEDLLDFANTDPSRFNVKDLDAPRMPESNDDAEEDNRESKSLLLKAAEDAVNRNDPTILLQISERLRVQDLGSEEIKAVRTRINPDSRKLKGEWPRVDQKLLDRLRLAEVAEMAARSTATLSPSVIESAMASLTSPPPVVDEDGCTIVPEGHPFDQQNQSGVDTSDSEGDPTHTPIVKLLKKMTIAPVGASTGPQVVDAPAVNAQIPQVDSSIAAAPVIAAVPVADSSLAATNPFAAPQQDPNIVVVSAPPSSAVSVPAPSSAVLPSQRLEDADFDEAAMRYIEADSKDKARVLKDKFTLCLDDSFQPSEERRLKLLDAIQAQQKRTPLHDAVDANADSALQSEELIKLMLDSFPTPTHAKDVINRQDNESQTAFEIAIANKDDPSAKSLFDAGAETGNAAIQIASNAVEFRKEAQAVAAADRSKAKAAIKRANETIALLRYFAAKGKPNAADIVAEEGAVLKIIAADAIQRDDPALLSDLLDIPEISGLDRESVDGILVQLKDGNKTGGKWSKIKSKLEKVLAATRAEVEAKQLYQAVAVTPRDDAEALVALQLFFKNYTESRTPPNPFQIIDISKSPNGEPLSHIIARQGRKDTFQELFAYGNPNIVNPSGKSLLAVAVETGNPPIVEVVAEYADAATSQNASDKTTPLHLAALGLRAAVLNKDQDGKKAAQKVTDAVEIIRILDNFRHDASVPNKVLGTPLDLIGKIPFVECQSDEMFDAARKLAVVGINDHMKDYEIIENAVFAPAAEARKDLAQKKQGKELYDLARKTKTARSAVMAQFLKGRSDAETALLRKRKNLADTDSLDLGDLQAINADIAAIVNYSEGGVPLVCFAAQKGDSLTTKVLLEEGADINSADSKKETLLHYAVASGDEDLVKLVLSKAPDKDQKFGSAQTAPIHVAAHNFAKAVAKGRRPEIESAIVVMRALDENGHDINLREEDVSQIFRGPKKGKNAVEIAQEADFKGCKKELLTAITTKAQAVDADDKFGIAGAVKKEEDRRQKLIDDAKKAADEKKEKADRRAAAKAVRAANPSTGAGSFAARLLNRFRRNRVVPLISHSSGSSSASPLDPLASGASHAPATSSSAAAISSSPIVVATPAVVVAEPDPMIPLDQIPTIYEGIVSDRSRQFFRIAQVDGDLVLDQERREKLERQRSSDGTELFEAFVTGITKIYSGCTVPNSHEFDPSDDSKEVWTGQHFYEGKFHNERSEYSRLDSAEKMALIIFSGDYGRAELPDFYSSITVDPKDFLDKIDTEKAMKIVEKFLQPKTLGAIIEWADNKAKNLKRNPSPTIAPRPGKALYERSLKALHDQYKGPN